LLRPETKSSKFTILKTELADVITATRLHGFTSRRTVVAIILY